MVLRDDGCSPAFSAAGQLELRAAAAHPARSFRPLEAGGTLPELFARAARAHAGKTAVTSPAGSLTYRDLETLALRVAAFVGSTVRGRGADGEVPRVGLLLRPGHEMVAALLGTLSAGAAWVPLDPSYPAARTRLVLADADVALVVAEEDLLAEVSASLPGVPVVGFAEASRPAPAAQAVAPSPDSLALLVYTSGSTGRPKGVMHTHRTLLREARAYVDLVQLCPDDRAPLVSSFAFADSLRTTFGALLVGAELMPFDVKREGFPALARWFRARGATLWRGLPTALRLLCEGAGDGAALEGVRVAYCGGEPLLASDLAVARRLFGPRCVVVNGLGATECLTYCACYLATSGAASEDPPPVGRPLEDCSVRLVDDELSVRSASVSPGYWRNPTATASAFRGEGAEREYRTGDVACQRADGCFMHLGRRDFQVKIRGHRVEASEVEQALVRQVGVRAAAVAARPPGAAARLVAYVVPAPGVPATASSLRAALAAALPDYMVPAVFVFLDALPRLPNGKLDRAGLPEPSRARPLLAAPLRPPADEVEARLARIWAQALNLEEVGADDPFLELGGDSLTASGIAARIRDAFGVELGLADLLTTPTVAALARRLGRPGGPCA